MGRKLAYPPTEQRIVIETLHEDTNVIVCAKNGVVDIGVADQDGEVDFWAVGIDLQLEQITLFGACPVDVIIEQGE